MSWTEAVLHASFEAWWVAALFVIVPWLVRAYRFTGSPTRLERCLVMVLAGTVAVTLWSAEAIEQELSVKLLYAWPVFSGRVLGIAAMLWATQDVVWFGGRYWVVAVVGTLGWAWVQFGG